MQTFSVSRAFPWKGRITDKVASVMRMFGVDADRLRTSPTTHSCTVRLRPGDICYITGPSGGGKSVLLRELYAAAAPARRLRLCDIELAADKSVIDCIEGDFFTALKVLSKAGLSDVFAVLNQPGNLSKGQKYRYRLARALLSDSQMIFADEFCSNLDRITAAVISCNLRTVAAHSDKIFVLAGAHDDLLCDLQPDVIIVKRLGGPAEVIYKHNR